MPTSTLLAPSVSAGARATAAPAAPAPAPAPAQAQVHQAVHGLVLVATALAPLAPSLALVILVHGLAHGLALVALKPSAVPGMVTPTLMFARALTATVVTLTPTLGTVQVHGLVLLPTATGVLETTTTTTPSTVARSSTMTVCMRTRMSTLARSARSGVAMVMAATAATKALKYMRKQLSVALAEKVSARYYC